MTQLACTFGINFGVVTYAKDSERLTAADPVRRRDYPSEHLVQAPHRPYAPPLPRTHAYAQVFRVKGSKTPVQCASPDLVVDAVTGADFTVVC